MAGGLGLMTVANNEAPPGFRRPLVPGKWTFWCDTIIGAIPLGPVQPLAFRCSWKLSGFGAGSVTLPADSVALHRDQVLRLWSWRIWAFYAGEVVWCGIPTGITDDGGPAVSLTLTELPGYLVKRQFDVSPSARYDQVEQTEIARQLAQPVEDVGVVILTEPGPGFLRDRTYEFLEGQNRAELLTNLSGVISGPQFRAEYGLTPAHIPSCALRIAYPRVGTDVGLGLTVPGRAVAHSAAWDGDQLRTRTFAVGDLPEDAAEGEPRPCQIEDRPQAGLPRLDARDEWPSVILLSTLAERAATAATQQAAPALELTGTAPENSPPVGSYRVGDTVTLNITTPLLAGGLTAGAVLTEIEANAAAGTASWTVAVTSPPPVPRATLTATLARMQSSLGRVLTRGAQPV
jgi:hypothetical protein